MLYDLIKANRELLLFRIAHLSEIGRVYSYPQTAALGHISIFLDQLTEALHIEHGTAHESVKTPAKLLRSTTNPSPAVRMSLSACDHGRELRDSNLTIAAVVRNYGSVCQAVTEYALEVNATVDVAEFRTLNWCLDEAIANAVIAFTTPEPADAWFIKTTQLKHDARLDGMAKMADHVERIGNAVAAMRTGRVGLDGATGAVLDASLKALRDLIDQGIDQRI